MSTQDLVERMKEAIPQRRFVETTESFCELVTRGYPVRQAVQDVIDAGARYTHLPYHLSIQHGRPHKVSNDHCLLDTRAALYLMEFMPPGMTLLPLVQSIWYWPQGLDVWGQTKLPGWSGDTTDTILALMNVFKAQGDARYPSADDWSAYPPVHSYYATDVKPLTQGSAQERLEAFRNAVMLCHQDEAYGLFLGLAPEHGIRQQLSSDLLYAAITDVQERIRGGHLKTLQHTSLRARAALDLADYVGWEQAHSVFQAAIPDIAMGPRFYALHDHIATLCDDAFGSTLSGLKSRNTTPLNAAETAALIVTICRTDSWAISGMITQLLQAGKAVQSIADAITLAAARIVTLAEQNASNPIIWVHSVDYCNVVNTWLRQYDHPNQVHGLYFMALVTHYAIPGFPKPAFADSVEFVTYKSSVPAHVAPDEMLQHVQAAIENLDVPISVKYADAYVHSGAPIRPLQETLALATSKTQDNPHHHKIVSTALEEYTLSTSPQKGEFLVMAAAYLAAARSMHACYELYGKHFAS